VSNGSINTMFRVEHSIPLVKRMHLRNKYPFHKMEVRDSFLVPCESYEVEGIQNSLTSCMRNAAAKNGWRYTQRAVLGGVRVWRVE
jgi:hypothetical protein